MTDGPDGNAGGVGDAGGGGAAGGVGGAAGSAAVPGFDRHMLEALVCPRSQARLDYDAARQELVSQTGGLAFPIRNGIPVLVIDEARALD